MKVLFPEGLRRGIIVELREGLVSGFEARNTIFNVMLVEQ